MHNQRASNQSHGSPALSVHSRSHCARRQRVFLDMLQPALVLLAVGSTVQAVHGQPIKPSPATVPSRSPRGVPPQAQSTPSPAAAAAGPVAAAADEDDDSDDDEVGENDGTIVRIDGDLLYFDVGTNHGVRVGQIVRVLRTIVAKHPVTGKRLVDHFPLGTLIVEGTGTVMSVGKAQRRIAPLVKIGDVVNVSQPAPAQRAVVSASAPATPASPAAGEKGRAAGLAPASVMTPTAVATPTAVPQISAPTGLQAPVAEPTPAAQVHKAYEATLGRPLPERIRVFEAFLATHRETPYRAALEQELLHLRTMQNTLEQAVVQLARAREQIARAPMPRPAPERSDAPVANVLVPRKIYAGEPLEVAIYVGNPGQVQHAMLYIRREGEATYQLLPFKEDATGYFRILVPSRLAAAGTVELFVGLRDSEGRLLQRLGSAELPTDVVIEAPIGAPPSPGPNHSAVSGFFEFVDFNRFRGNDYYFNAEADFMYRIGGVLYSVRTGFGTLSGYGESVNNLDVLNQAPRPVGINYGYLEGELRFHRLVGLAVRGLAGQSKAGPGGGAELKLRIGSEMGTNLIIGGAIISDFGALAQLKLEWNVIRSWPMSVTVVATNQPVQTDLGVRLIYQVGWRFRHWFAPTLRIGYDVRNINHGGLSLGLGVVMGW